MPQVEILIANSKKKDQLPLNGDNANPECRERRVKEITNDSIIIISPRYIKVITNRSHLVRSRTI